MNPALKYKFKIIMLVLASALTFVIEELFYVSLLDISFISGWVLLGLIGGFTLREFLAQWHDSSTMNNYQWRNRTLIFGWIVLVLFIIHSGFHLPKSVFGVVRTLCLVALAIGYFLLYEKYKNAELPSQNLRQALIATLVGLVSLSFAHGILTHAHGALAGFAEIGVAR